MCGVSGIELMVIVIAAVIFLGPDRLPEAMRTLGKLMREVRKVTGELTSVRDDFTKSMREQSSDINETVQRRESAGRGGQDVSDIDAIRAKRAAETVEAVQPAATEDAAPSDSVDVAPTLESADTPVAVGAPAVPAATLAATLTASSPTRAAEGSSAKPAVQIRPAARTAATFSNPYRPSSSGLPAATLPTAPVSGDTVPLDSGSVYVPPRKPASPAPSKAEAVQVTTRADALSGAEAVQVAPAPNTDDGEQA